MADKNTLKQWFVTGAKPLQAQYWAWLDSYWHKSEAISINAIDGLGEILESKADADQLQHYALLDASNIGPNQGAWRTALGINDITPPDVDLTNYYTRSEVDGLLENVTVDLTNYHTITQYQQWVNDRGFINSTTLSTEVNTRYPKSVTNIDAPDSIYLYVVAVSESNVTRRLNISNYLTANYASLSNFITAWGTPTNTQIPSAKLVKDSIDALVTGLTQPIKTITSNTTLDNTYHNAIVRVTANCTITVPSTLRADFNAVFEAIGNISATFLEDTNTVFSAPFGKLLKDNSMCNLYKYNATTYRLNGGLLPV